MWWRQQPQHWLKQRKAGSRFTQTPRSQGTQLLRLLTTVDGFATVTLTQSSIVVGGAQSVRIANNPAFPTCRANALKALCVSAGFSAAAMLISGNLADCN